jgi:hypothetical protein
MKTQSRPYFDSYGYRGSQLSHLDAYRSSGLATCVVVDVIDRINESAILNDSADNYRRAESYRGTCIRSQNPSL